MFTTLNQLPPDPILGLIAAYRDDEREEKIDLGVGVYRDATGSTPVLDCVKAAETLLLQQESTKAYIGPLGNLAFTRCIGDLALGSIHPRINDLAVAQTPGGCGALRVAAELVKRSDEKACIWVSDPTWGNHQPLLGDAGVRLNTYPYYNFQTHSLRFDEMLSTLATVPAGDLVLLHACCHNPSGADLSKEQWQQVAELAEQRGFVPFIDMAYQGFAEGIDEDAFGLRLLCERLPQVLFAQSCSKNFGLYRERVGAVALVCEQARVSTVNSHFASIARGIYSMPPAHGAAIVATILSDEKLTAQWQSELSDMRQRIEAMRHGFVDKINRLGAAGRFDHIRAQKGMFSFLGITAEQVAALANQHAVYLVSSGRLSLAGLNPGNLEAFCHRLLSVL